MSSIGNRETRTDILTPALAARFAATIDRDVRGDVAPQGIHWCLCTPEAATDALGPDGHPAGGGGFLPPSPLPRRMWASSDVTFRAPIPVGAAIRRESTIASATEKRGSSGALLFVTVDHVTHADGIVAIEETQTLVYREADTGTAPAAPPPAPKPDEAPWHWRRGMVPTEPLLFRYSALTFNSHRIHYDQPYATAAEGYRGLVVHGPLMATLLLDLCDRELGLNALARFTFRAVSPAFVEEPLVLLGRREGDGLVLAARGGDGRTVVSATAEIAAH